MNQAKYSRLPTGEDGESDRDQNLAGSFELQPIGENGKPLEEDATATVVHPGRKRETSRWDRMGPKRKLAFVLSVIFCGSVIALFLVLPQLMHRVKVGKKRPIKDATWQLSAAAESISWSVDFPSLAVESSVRLFDADGDGVRDPIVGFGMAARKHLRPTKAECSAVRLPFPCYGGVVALSGRNGTVLWRYAAQGEVFAILCGRLDVNQDGRAECIVAGRRDVLDAVDVQTGKSLWPEKEEFGEDWNFYTPSVIRDVDSDGVEDLLVVHGGLVYYPPSVLCRNASAVLLISGKTGQTIGRPVSTPDAKESYMSPVVSAVGVGKGKTDVVFVGSGGETVSGSLWAFTLDNIIALVSGQPAKQWSWGKCESSTKSAVIQLASGVLRGVAVPPVMADVTADGVLDVVISVFDGQVLVRDGADCHVVWQRSFHGYEYYSSPSLGRFDDDDVPDVVLQLNRGAWWKSVYYDSMVTVLSGHTGITLWSMKTRSEVFSSPLSILRRPNSSYGDIFLFWTSGRQAWPSSNWSRKKCSNCGTSQVLNGRTPANSKHVSPYSSHSSPSTITLSASSSTTQSLPHLNRPGGVSAVPGSNHSRVKRHGNMYMRLGNEENCPPTLVERSKQMSAVVHNYTMSHRGTGDYRAGCNVDENIYTAEVYLMDKQHSCQLVRIVDFPSFDYKPLGMSRQRRHGDDEVHVDQEVPLRPETTMFPPSEDPSLCARMRCQPHGTGAIADLADNGQLSFAYAAPFLSYVSQKSSGSFVRNEYLVRIGVVSLTKKESLQLVGNTEDSACSDGFQQRPVKHGIVWTDVLNLRQQPWLGYLGTCAESTFSPHEHYQTCGVVK